jgi:hypothetical protein
VRRRLVLVALVVAAIVALALLARWTWPARWMAAPPPQPLAVADPRPQWARSSRFPPLQLPPVSVDRAATDPVPEPPPEGALVEPDPPEGTISGWVVDARGRSERWARVEVACVGPNPVRRFVRADDGGFFRVTLGAPAECEVAGFRMDGPFRALSQPEFLDVLPGDDLEIDLIVPAERIGGIGMQIREDPRGILVDALVPGMPADAIGLRVGDVVVEVGGVPTRGLSTDDFIRLMTGPVGSEVAFSVVPGEAPDGAPVTLRAVRSARD